MREAGVLRVGDARTAALFSQLDEEDGGLRGFDAGLFQLLANYIPGNPGKYELTQVTSGIREDVLITDQVDAVFTTYSIPPSRQEVISFAGPYFTSWQGILVRADNDSINGLEDLAGKAVATQQGSSGPTILGQYAPEATAQAYVDDETAQADAEVGRANAYVTDYMLILGSIVRNPGLYRVAGFFDDNDDCGIGLPRDSDGLTFVNGFLRRIEKDGLWAELWKIGLGDRIGGVETAPEPPVIAE